MARLLAKRDTLSKKAVLSWGTVLVVSVSCVQLFIFSDRQIFKWFGFHINGFVWNMVKTKGGLESMGMDVASVASYTVYALCFLALQIGLLLAAAGLARKAPDLRGCRHRKALSLIVVTAFFLGAVGQSLAYGVSELIGYASILSSARQYPFYFPPTLRTVAKKFGFRSAREYVFEALTRGTTAHYPLKKLEVNRPSRPLNIVWLVAESRADMLHERIMPAAWSFAQRAHCFKKHYSGGNGTRIGVFSMFYGLSADYWFRMLEMQREPVLMDVLREQGYQFGLFTSARFTYPEFDCTVFAGVKHEDMHEYDDGRGWERDRHNTGEIMSFIKSRDRARPFMVFSFYESPHARYYFPEEAVIARPYLEEFNYATVELEKDIALIKNRYENSVHHLDTQFGRLLKFLEEEGLLDSTIVLITGDHGEEFMEHHRWGHNSAFNDEQVLVPMILYIPATPRALSPE